MALTPPPDPEEGEQVLPWARAIGKLLRQIIPRESADIWPYITSTGTSFVLRKKGVNQDAPVTPTPPLFILDATTYNSDGSVNVAQVRITWGTIQGIQPTGFSAGDSPPYIVPVSDDTYFYGLATLDLTTLLWNSASILDTGDPSDAANTTTAAYELIGSVTLNDAGAPVISNASQGNIYFSMSELQ